MTMTERTPILCDCCGRQVMGYRLDDAVVWYHDHHGKRHTVKVPLDNAQRKANNQVCRTK